ncbi:MAG: hypothetical protein KF883_14265 [Thermomicrobiales bacterium]|nr:hypothetical protein [Thermomicrobiales bacterium]
MTDRPSPFGILGRALGTGPLGGLKRYLRWFNLTMLQQALWPLLIAVASAPHVALEHTPTGWFLLRLAGPLLAVVVAFLYLRSPKRSTAAVIPSVAEGSLVHDAEFGLQEVPHGNGERDSSAPLRSGRNDERDGSGRNDGRSGLGRNDARALLLSLITPPANIRFPAVATQFRYALYALPVVVTLLRFLNGPADEAAKVVAFGLVNVAAYHLIHFGVVPLSFEDARPGLLAGAVLFGVSWGLHNALMFGLSDGGWLPGLAAGLVLGWAFGFGALALRQWPGGWLTGAAVHFLVVYLIAGFV